MANVNNLQKANAEPTLVAQIRESLSGTGVKKEFYRILGDKAAQYMASIVNIAARFPQGTNPNSIMAAAFVGATYDLPIDSNLGFSAIVPYNSKGNKEAQFQIMYKGFIQLAIRSGMYEKMNCSEVYQDEIETYNPITGELEFVKDFSVCTDRDSGDEDKIAGYYAWFKLKTGFSHELYMTKQSVINHAKKYSQAYKRDLKSNEETSPWSTNFNAMAMKTVLKRLLSKWGILSVDMQRAIQDDQKTFDDAGKSDYGDNKPDIVPGAVIDAEPVTDPFAQNAPSDVENDDDIQNSTEDNQTHTGQPQKATAISQVPSNNQAAPAGEPPSMYDAISQDIDLAGLAHKGV